MPPSTAGLSDLETQIIIMDFLRYKCLQAGFYWNPSRTSLPNKLDKTMATMRRITREYEEAYRHAYSEIDSYSVKVDCPNAQSSFNECMDDMFSDGQYNWGRIVGMFSYGGMLAIQAMTLNKPELVSEVSKWMYEYMQRPQIKQFTTSCDGWSGFVKQFKKPLPFMDFKSLLDFKCYRPWWTTAGAVTAVAGGLTGAILLSKIFNI